MPLYDYRCPDCGRRFERFGGQRDRVVRCECGGRAVRCVSLPAIHYRGGGWAGRRIAEG